MKNKVIIISSVVAGLVILLLGTLIGGLSYMYKDRVSYGVWINGEYCTGKTVDEVNVVLKTYSLKPVITITDKDYNTDVIYAADYDYSADYNTQITQLVEKQGTFEWVKHIFDSSVMTIEPEVTYDENKLIQLVSQLPVYQKYLNMGDSRITLVKDGASFSLVDETHESLNYDMLIEAVCSVATSGGTVSVNDDFFYKENLSEADIKAQKDYENLQAYLETKIIYDMGADQIPIDNTVLVDFLVLDENDMPEYDEDGSILLDDEKIKEYVKELCSQYDTVTLPSTYTTYKGKTVTVPNAYSGTQIDTAKEQEYLVEAIHAGISETHQPKYIRKGILGGRKDLGLNYIEVDITEQKMYMILNGELFLESDVVTGNPNKGWATPVMLCYMYNKMQDAILRGEGYASPVDYWMPVYKGIGLHDASWQTRFGGDWYLTHGSRGCINLPDGVATQVYENSYIGIPVLIYK